MKNIKAAVLSVIVFALFACEHPFKAGLGPVVDIRPPTVTLEYPNAGDPIWGTITFKGSAEDDYLLESVWIRVTNFPEVEYLKEYEKVNLTIKQQNKGVWDWDIDTTQFKPDGDLKIQLKVVDSVNKEAETGEIVFLIRNERPTITVSSPYIPEWNGEGEPSDGELRGLHLNYGAVTTLPVSNTYRRQMDVGSPLTGTIRDNEDIYVGGPNPEKELYPPQIRVWRVTNPGVIPTEAEVPWKDLTISDKTLFQVDLGSYLFVYDTPYDIGFYGFEMRAQKKDGRSDFRYPRDYWSGNWDNLSENGDFKRENCYVLFHIRAPLEFPTVDLYGLENIFGDITDNRYANLPGIDDNMVHPYVNKETVNKNGSFTLRVKANHSEGIGTAEVYWEKDDGSLRGRFIWDLANVTPAGARNSWKESDNVPADRDYRYWGYGDGIAVDRTRNFIYTYNHGGNNLTPSVGVTDPQAKGRSKIQVFQGTTAQDLENWERGKKRADAEGVRIYESWYGDTFNTAIWKEMEDPLTEGVYNIEVYTTSTYGTRIGIPLTAAIRLDWRAPDVEVTGIDGVDSVELDLDKAVARVNGVINPRIRFADSRPEDSGLRSASNDYFVTGKAAYEQLWVLVDDASKTEMDTRLQGNWWPSNPALVDIPGVTVIKQGVVSNGNFKFRTSKIGEFDSGIEGLVIKADEDYDNEPDVLGDGFYWLYVFARDNAFNVGHSTPLRLEVKYETDFPVFDFSEGSVTDEVTEASVSADVSLPLTGNGFRSKDGDLRNVLGPNTTIMVKLRDDDSLDLGSIGDAGSTSITLSFTGSTTDTNGEVTALGGTHIMKFEPAEVRDLFAPQPSGNFFGRSAIKERKGEITQQMLLEKLKGNSNYASLFVGKTYTGLPDGIYQITMSVSDYAPAKLTMDGDPPKVVATAERTTSFWIAMDTVGPEVKLTSPPLGNLNAGVNDFTGTVSDQNGPITGEWSLKRSDGGVIGGPTTGAITTIKTGTGSLWTGDFSAGIELESGISATYIITLTFTDRFGKKTTVERRHTVDQVKPEVSSPIKIKTFSRPGVAGDYNPVLTAAQYDILANGIVSFTIRATDNLKVAEARWWLLPSGTTPAGFNHGTIASLSAGTTGSVTDGKGGRFIDNFGGTTFYVNIGDLTDKTTYVLWAAAKDEAGNYSGAITSDTSGVPVKLQEIYILKDEDKPWFGPADNISLNNKYVGQTGAVLTGTIWEDDGFFLANGNVRTGSVKIWMSNRASVTAPPAGTLDNDSLLGTYLYNNGYNTAAGLTGSVSFPTDASDLITVRRVGGNSNNVILNINLYAQFGNGAAGTIFNADGVKHYIIEAEDSWYGKFANEAGAPATDVADYKQKRRKYFSFTYDNADPKITVSAPAADSKFGNNAGTAFALKVTISDTNLLLNGDNDFFISYRTENENDYMDLPLGKAEGTAGGVTIHSIGTGNSSVEFTITAAKLTEIIKWDTLSSGRHTLFLQVRDKSGRRGYASLNFIKDTDAPVIEFSDISKVTLPDVGSPASPWWTAPDNVTYWQAKQTAARNFSVIQYTEGGTAVLKGTITDEISNVNSTFNYRIDNSGTDRIGSVLLPTVPGKNKSWEILLVDDTNKPLPDGVHSIRINASDEGGNDTDSAYAIHYAFILVSTPPEISLGAMTYDVFGDRTPTGTVTTNETIFRITGTASSASLENVRLGIRYTDSSVYSSWSGLVTAPVTTTSGMTGYTSSITFQASPYLEKNTWGVNITRSALYAATGKTTSQGKLLEGTYELSAVALDRSGNVSDEATWTFIIDSTKPVITVNNLNTDTGAPAARLPAYWVSNATNKTNRNVILSSTPQIQVRISDPNGVNAVGYRIVKYNYATGTAGAWPDAGTFTSVTGITTPVANYQLNLNLGATTAELPNGLNLDDGYYYIQVQAKDSSRKWENTTPDVWADTGNGNPEVGTSTYVYFFLSRSNPTLVHVDESTQKFSSRIRGAPYNLPFAVRATDANYWFESMVVTVEPVNTASATTERTITGLRTGTDPWAESVNIPFALPTYNGTTLTGGYPDGAYTLTFTVTNLAGRSTNITRTITLDNTSPSAQIDEPRFIGNVAQHNAEGQVVNNGNNILYRYASDTMFGGDPFTIKGTAADTGDRGSASGVSQIWYHLGYLDNNANIYTINGNTVTTTFPTEAQIRATVLGAGVTDNNTSNAAFDTAATANGNAWFKYDTAPVYPKPTNFSLPTGALDPYNWVLNVSDIKGYESAITMKGIAFNAGGTRYMAKPISETQIPMSLRKGGIYSLPLWIRVSDGVGNVYYTCRDIWIYPNGDNPSSVIINPSESYTGDGSPRGGVITIDGVANDNRSVRNVIFRVRADSRRQGDAGWNTDAPSETGNVVTGFKNLMKWEDHPEYSGTGKMSEIWNWYNTSPRSMAVNKNGWYMATLESSSFAPDMPWSFILNDDKALQDAIATYGFRGSGTGDNDTVRIYLEVFVFDGKQPAANSDYNLMSLGDNNTNANAPRPYTRIFYFKDTAPSIGTLQITQKGSVSQYESYNTGQVRSGQFRLTAALDGGGIAIGQISIQLPGEDNSLWQTVWQNGTNNNVPGMSVQMATGNRTGTLTCSFNSLVTTLTGGFAPVRGGAWAAGGGTFTVRVRVRDGGDPPGEASHTFEVGIDNFAPVADREKNITATKVAGSNVVFLGRAFDYNGSATANVLTSSVPYRGIDRIYAWFTKNQNGTSQYINMNTKMDTTNTMTTDSITARVNRNAEVEYNGDTVTGINLLAANYGTSDSRTYPRPGTGTGAEAGLEVSTDYVKVISERTSGTLANKITWQPNNNNNWDILWNFTADTGNMPDGWMYLNYLVVDTSGNASYYQQRMVVMNNYPQITNVTLYTNNRGEGAAFTTHDDPDAYTSYEVNNGAGTGINNSPGYINSGFIAKNRTIGFGVKTISGNQPLQYRTQYVHRVPIKLTKDNLNAMAKKTAGTNGFTSTLYRNGIESENDANKVVVTTLYTIKSLGDIDRFTWGTLGAKEAYPAVGNHFVFQGDPDVVKTFVEPDGAEVWAYEALFAVEDQRDDDPATAAIPPFHSADSDNKPDDFSFVGANYFGAGKILQLTGSQPEETQYNNPDETAYFLIKVWDTVDSNLNRPITGFGEDHMLYDAIVVGMNVFLTDHKNPTVRIYDLNPYTETAVVGNNINATMRTRTMTNAAAPTAVGYNILRGGLYNVKTERELVKSGYIEPRDGSTALKPQIKDPYTGRYAPQNAHGYVDAIEANNYGADAVSATGSNQDKVSGTVILRGQAWDDQLINEITLTINGTAVPILRLLPVRESDGDVRYTPWPVTTVPTGYVRKMVGATAATQAWAFEELHWKTGHTVEWAYVWNTEGVNTNGAPLTNVTITAAVTDVNGTPVTNPDATPGLTNGAAIPVASENQANEIFHNQVRVDIVPYVVGFERQSKFATTRSRQGWYSFFQGESGIALLGYNLGNTGNANTAPAMLIRYRNAAGAEATTTINTVALNNDATRFPFPRRYNFTIPDAAASGGIEVTANGAQAYNYTSTSTHTSKSWNRESNRYTDGSELWMNRPHAHIWRTTQSVTAPATYFGNGTDSANLSHPGMTLEYANANSTNPGRLHATWSIYGTANSYYGANANAARTPLYNDTNGPPSEPYVDPDISIFNGRFTGVGTAAAQQDTANIVMVQQMDGIPFVAMKTLMNNTNNPTQISDGGTSGTNATNPGPTQRWRNQRIAKAAQNNAVANNNVGRAYVTSYDSRFKNLWFGSHYGAGNNTRYIIDGTTPTVYGTAATYGVTAIAPDKTAASGGRLDAVSNAGEYSAVDYDQYGPVIAYYDYVNDTVRLAYGNASNNANPPVFNNNQTINNWGRQYVIPATHTLHKGSGKYVSIKVDRQNRIHLAFYNSNLQTVVYASAPARASGNGTGAVFTFDTIHTVDSVIKGGTWTDISVDNYGNPWIVYGNTPRTGNYDGVRVAYRSESGRADIPNGIQFSQKLLCPETGTDISRWESLTMPADYTVNNDRLNVEVWPPTNRNNGGTAAAPAGTLGTRAAAQGTWSAAIGYGSTVYRIGYFTCPTYKGY
jgi:hypothetical protein